MYSAEIPFKKGRNRDVFASNRTNSPRYVRPMTNNFLPSLLGSGDDNVMGLEVKRVGLGADRKIPAFARAQIWPWDWKTKYLPSVVHLPQHSSGGLCQPGSNGCRPVPSTETSRSICKPTVPAVSEESNRR